MSHRDIRANSAFMRHADIAIVGGSPTWSACATITAPLARERGRGQDKIAEFYDDEVKRDCDAASEAKAYFLRARRTTLRKHHSDI